LKYPPFESKALNFIEVGVEVFVLSCQYCMFCFLFELKTEELRNKIGLAFSILVLIQLVLSFVGLMLMKIIKAWPAVKGILLKVRTYLYKVCTPKA
jgi:hypothetical protein